MSRDRLGSAALLHLLDACAQFGQQFLKVRAIRLELPTLAINAGFQNAHKRKLPPRQVQAVGHTRPGVPSTLLSRAALEQRPCLLRRKAPHRALPLLQDNTAWEEASRDESRS